MKKTTQQKRGGYTAINPPSIFQNDFGYKGQKFFRNYKCPVYRSTEHSLVMFPYQMEDMVKRKLITGDQVLRFMEMLESDNQDMNMLAITMLCELRSKMVRELVRW